jgi:hypothetical protein
MKTVNQEQVSNTEYSNKNTDTTENINNTYEESEFNRETITQLGNRVRLTDSGDGLELFCYVNCSSDDDTKLQQCRGVVFHENEVVMKAFPYTIEYGHHEFEQIDKNINSVFDKCSFYDAYEGNLVRLFHFNNKWYISTHRKLNAFKSKWASKESFGTCFKRALESEVQYNEKLSSALPKNDAGLLERFQSTLDKEKQYMFLVLHSDENRIVCSAPERPTLYHVGTFVEGSLVMTEDCNIPYPKKHNFSSMKDLLAYVENIHIRDLQGIICFTPNNKQIKINHSDYNELFRARGNEPSIKFRYLQVRMNRKVADMLFHLYPEMATTFDDIENNIYELAKNIYNAYVQRFIKKRFVTVPTEEFAIVRECHSWHEEDRIMNRINLNKVIEVFNKQTPTSINRMLRRYKMEKEQQSSNKETIQVRNRSNTVSTTGESPATNSAVPSPLILPNKPNKEVEAINLV